MTILLLSCSLSVSNSPAILGIRKKNPSINTNSRPKTLIARIAKNPQSKEKKKKARHILYMHLVFECVNGIVRVSDTSAVHSSHPSLPLFLQINLPTPCSLAISSHGCTLWLSLAYLQLLTPQIPCSSALSEFSTFRHRVVCVKRMFEHV